MGFEPTPPEETRRHIRIRYLKTDKVKNLESGALDRSAILTHGNVFLQITKIEFSLGYVYIYIYI